MIIMRIFGFNASAKNQVGFYNNPYYLLENVEMKLSARNQIQGKVKEIKKGATTAHIKIDIGNNNLITSSITNEAADDLNIQAGDTITVIIKASDVILGK